MNTKYFIRYAKFLFLMSYIFYVLHVISSNSYLCQIWLENKTQIYIQTNANMYLEHAKHIHGKINQSRISNKECHIVMICIL